MRDQLVSELLGSLRRAVSNSNLYPDGHPESELAIDLMMERIGALTFGADQVVLSIVDSGIYLNRELMPNASLEHREMYQMLTRRGLESITFGHNPSTGDLKEFAQFLSTDSNDVPAEGTIRLNERPFTRAELLEASRLSEIRHSYVASLDFLGEVALSMSDGSGADTSDAVWTVEQLLEKVLLQPGASLLLSTLKTHDEYTFFHSINTSLLALTVGRAVGLDEDALVKLGVGALLHDLGKIRIPQEIIQYPGRLGRDQWNEMQRHPQEGAQAILGGSGPEQEIAARVAFEHHARFDATGYPHVAGRESIHLFSRITSICDVYDALTTRRAYKRAHPPASALKVLVAGAGSQFDPHLVEVFVGMLGIFPTGSLVRLDAGEVAVILSPPTESAPMQAAVLDGGAGQVLAEFEPFELSPDRITALLLPDEVGIDPASLAEYVELHSEDV